MPREFKATSSTDSSYKFQATDWKDALSKADEWIISGKAGGHLIKLEMWETSVEERMPTEEEIERIERRLPN